MSHPLDRRSLLRAGAGVVAVAASAPTLVHARGEKVTRLVFRGRFRKPDTPDWHYLPFRVPRGVTEIRVRYEHEPTDLGPISFNVVDIGIFDPSGRGIGNAAGFRGWSGGARRRFRISRTRATPGYLPGPITPGRWHVILGPYLITPPGTPYRVVVDLVHGRRPGPRFRRRPAPTAVAGTGPGWYRGDLHTHTRHSDGRWRRPGLVAAAREAGLALIGSSEHNTSSAGLDWGKHVPDDFLVVTGEEVTTRAGHWLAMGLPAGTWVDWRYRPQDDELPRFTERVHELGGVAIACHPSNPVRSIGWGFGSDFDHMDAVEVWNGPWAGSNNNQAALANWDRLLRQGRFVPAVGSSDTHHEGQAVGLAQSVFRLDTLSTEAVVAAVRGGHVYVAESSAVELVFEARLGAATASCGDTLDAAPPDPVSVSLTVTGVPGCVAQLLGPAGILAGAAANASGAVELSVELPAATIPWVRAEVRRPAAVGDPMADLAAAPMVALTNPVFVSASGA